MSSSSSTSPASKQTGKENPEDRILDKPEAPADSDIGDSSSTAPQSVEQLNLLDIPEYVKMLEWFENVKLLNAERAEAAGITGIPSQEKLELWARVDTTLKELEMEDLEPLAIDWMKRMTPELLEEVFDFCRKRKASGLTEANKIIDVMILGHFSLESTSEPEPTQKALLAKERRFAAKRKEREEQRNSIFMKPFEPLDLTEKLSREEYQ